MSATAETSPEIATFTIGARVVVAHDNSVKAKPGSVGRIAGFSASGGHPLVDVDGEGRKLIPARYLAPHDGPAHPAPHRERVPLADTLPPREPDPEPSPPAFDWAETPKTDPKIRIPDPVWTPEDAELAKKSADSLQSSEDVASQPAKRRGWTEERRQRFQATMAAKKAQTPPPVRDPGPQARERLAPVASPVSPPQRPTGPENRALAASAEPASLEPDLMRLNGHAGLALVAGLSAPAREAIAGQLRCVLGQMAQSRQPRHPASDLVRTAEMIQAMEMP